MKITETLDLCSRVATTNIRVPLTGPMARSVLGMMQGIREAKAETQKVITLMIQINAAITDAQTPEALQTAVGRLTEFVDSIPAEIRFAALAEPRIARRN